MYNCSNCTFSSEFDFSATAHEKFSHPIYPRKALFDCTYSDPEKHLCPDWDYETHLKVDLDSHLRERHQRCKKEFLYKLSEDAKTIGEEQCENCSFKTYSKFLWLLHAHLRGTDERCLLLDQILLIVEIKDEISNETDIKLLHCDNCSYKTKYRANLKSHIIHKHMKDDQIEWFYCNQCAHKSKTKTLLHKHIVTKHEPNDTKKWLHCDQCAYKTLLNGNLAGHKLRKHTPDEHVVKWYYCERCSFKSKIKRDLKIHTVRKHDDPAEWFECDQCSYITKMKYLFTRHKKKHTQDNVTWFHCRHNCPYKTDTKILLSDHIEKFHKAKWFRCDQCSYRTVVKASLQHHMLVKHTSADQIEWFTCAQCSYKAKSKHYLAKHTKRNHILQDLKVTYKCEHCSFKTHSGSSLKQHNISRHTADDQIKWFSCVQCSFRSKRSSGLNNHVKAMHTLTKN